MQTTPPLPLLRRVPPGAWAALTWCAATAYSLAESVVLPGEGPALFRRHGLNLPEQNLQSLGIALALTLVGCALLRRMPLPAVALLLSGSIAGAIALNGTEIGFPQFLAVDVALCSIAASRPRRSSTVAVALALGVVVGYPAARLLVGFIIGTSTELAVAVTAVVAWLLGNSMRQTRDYAERLGAQAAAQAVTAERLRISRELHDMVAHSMGVIALQAGAASRVIDTQPAQAREALSAIEIAGRETLSGLRRMLGALRRTEPGQPGQPGQPGRPADGVPLDPAPGLADVEGLALATTAAGVQVDVRWHGERRPLPPEIDMSAFRIVQESVTNVVRHAGGSSCQVSIAHGDEELSIEVVDSGPEPGHGRAGSPGTGYGLVGMRERVGLLNGEFTAAPRPEGGFRVAVRLPVPEGVR
ncbi:histidine kinase [Kitasatospora sp. MAP5-34]|uniref:sensor histidine kinase n=1 Tax=Kitasatospora sp. MAP5-34 TaxID=3035102 RepID=UPI002475F0D7|nr:histidine kinase [Kitasatospora sp. MAP5-34]MDH6579003.1 signal transduction histidine kinase [Kitasatospora sp. MAP5-34]